MNRPDRALSDRGAGLRGAKHLARLVFAAALTWQPLAATAGPPPWPDGEFSYYAEKITLGEVLRDFAAGFNLALESSLPLTEVVNGRFNLRTPTEFINRLGGTYGFVWFTHAGRLHVSSARELVVKSVYAPSISVRNTNLRALLATLGVLEAKFGWGELPEQGTVVVSGPPAYVELVEKTIRALPE